MRELNQSSDDKGIIFRSQAYSLQNPSPCVRTKQEIVSAHIDHMQAQMMDTWLLVVVLRRFVAN